MDHAALTEKRIAVLTRSVTTLVPDWRVEELGAFEYLSGGYSNANYRFARGNDIFVLRVPDRNRLYVNRAQEAAFYRQTRSIRLPELIAFDVETGCMITRFQAGTLLCDADVSPARVADYLRTLHAGLPPSGRRYDPLALARKYLSVGDPPAWIRDLAERTTWSPAVLASCHNDLNPWNVVVPDEGQWVTLDWEWFGDNDPLFDVVTLHQGMGLQMDSLPGLLARWHGEPVDAERLQRCLTAFWLREYAWAHAEGCNGNVRPEIATQTLMAEARLREFEPS